MTTIVSIRNEESPTEAPLARIKVETYTNGSHAGTRVLKPGEGDRFTVYHGQHLLIEPGGGE